MTILHAHMPRRTPFGRWASLMNKWAIVKNKDISVRFSFGGRTWAVVIMTVKDGPES